MGYEKFATKVGELKRAAIDAWMYSETGWGWEVRGDVYQVIGDSRSKVTRPGQDGEGGGDWSGPVMINIFGWDVLGFDDQKDAEFQGYFAEVRNTIDSIVGRWADLPDPAEVDEIVERCRTVSGHLSVEPVVADANSNISVASEDLAVGMNGISSHVAGLSGNTIDAFKDKFLLKLPMAIAGSLAISAVRGGVVAAEKAIWEKAREDVMATLETAIQAFNAIAQGTTATWQDQLHVFGLAAEGVSLFMPGVLGKVLETASFGVSLVPEPKGDSRAGVGAPGKYSEGVESLSKQLDALSQQIRAEEEALRESLTGTISGVGTQKGTYDLVLDRIYDLDCSVNMVESEVNAITERYMPKVQTALSAAASETITCTIGNQVARSADIGLGTYGPAYELYDLTILHYELTKDLAWEVENGAVQLHLALQDFIESDNQSADQLRDFAASLEGGSGFDPWD